MGALVIVGIAMLLAGAIGGTARHLLRNLASGRDNPETSYVADLLLGATASLITPLFLSLAKSNIIGNFVSAYEQHRVTDDLPVFFGFCLVAAFSAKSFVSNVTDLVLNMRKQQNELKEEVNDLEGDVQEISRHVEPIGDEPSPEEEEEAERKTGESERASEGGPPLGAAVGESLSPNQRQMLHALANSRFTWRSVAGVRKDAGLSRETAVAVLNDLISREFADRKPSKSGDWLYRITAAGRSAIRLPFP